jgi:general secretion pathway protein D
LANAPAGFRRQFYSKAFGSPTLIQGQTLNLLRLNPLASALGAQIQNNPAQGALFQFRFLQSVQANAVVQALRKDQTADQLLAPKLTQFNNQRAHVMVAQQRSYIADYDISGAVFDPVIRSFLVGVVLEVKPTVSNDKKYITLDLRPGTALELTPPQVVFITFAGNDVNVGGGGFSLPIFLPNIELRSISTTVTVPDNGTMLFSGLISDRKIDAKSGIPLLSDLPIVGRFFSSNNKERVRRNLLVLVNSRVILFDEEEARL